MWLALQLSHNDVLGVGLGWVLGLGGPESLPVGLNSAVRLGFPGVVICLSRGLNLSLLLW